MGAAATVFAARLELAGTRGDRTDDVKLGSCAADVFLAWQDMIKRVQKK